MNQTTRRGTIDLDGCRLHYRASGDGEPVLLIQGVGAHGDAWQPQIEALHDGYRCVAFDNRGIGASQPLGTRLSVERMALDAHAVMDAQGWAEAHVVGHSLGGLVAQELALTERSRVRSLALLCTFARGKSVGKSWRMIALGLRSRLGTARMRRHAFLEMIYSPAALAATDRDALAAELAPVFGHDLAGQPPAAWLQLAAARAHDTTPRLRELDGLPTLAVAARFDPIAPPQLGRQLADAIPGASFVELADAAHGAPIQRAEEVNALLRRHWQAAAGGSVIPSLHRPAQ